MPRDDRRGLSCPRSAEVRCPQDACPGETDPGVCRHLARLDAWRKMTTEEQSSRLGTPRPAIDPAVRDAVNACTHRGPVLPISLQDDCGCLGKELSECRAGEGAIAGRVTLRDCLACQSK